MTLVRVLIVDDQADVRFLLRTILEDAPDDELAIDEAWGGDAALERLEADDFDIVVLDAMMPVLDGYETAARILDRHPGQPILLCTAHVDEHVAARARAVGVTNVVAKDQLDRIAEIVRSVESGREPARQRLSRP